MIQTGVVLNEVVLFVSDVERSKAFDTALGLDFARVENETSDGVITSYEAVLSGPVGFFFQLFPAGVRPSTRTRLRYEVDSLERVSERLRGEAFDHTFDESVYLLRATDPDGTRVYLLPRRR